MTVRFAAVAGTGSALASRPVSNLDLERITDTSDEWIRTRTGISSRRFVADGETASSLATLAGSRALGAAGVNPEALDSLIVATFSGDQPLPSTASFVQEGLGASGAAFDLNAACAGFVYGLEVGASMIAAGTADTVLVVGTEVISSFLDFSDRTTCVLFGDGAGAAVLVPQQEPGIVGSVLENDGRHARLLEIPSGGSREPVTASSVPTGRHAIQMADGRAVFRLAVDRMADTAARLLEKAGLATGDVSLLIPHQANARIIRAVAQRLGFPQERVVVDLADVGNTSAASVPIALDRAWRGGRIAVGDLVLTVAFGAGLAWGGNLIRWTAQSPKTSR